MDCIFCKIANKEIPADIVFENEDVMIFKDLSPQAPIHLLAIPKCHLESAHKVDKSNSILVAKIFEAIKEYMDKEGYHDKGYRIVTNVGEDAGQSVFHIHFHVLAGRDFRWPPG